MLLGQLNKYSLENNTVEDLGNFQSNNGQVFRFNKQTYFYNGSNAAKWNY
ncbi:hypothetical protein CHPG_00006 [Cellulophaga phage phi3:1]|nr:hypothetical protein CHPG_00006 [Cellulophaga phage phi3:1]